MSCLALLRALSVAGVLAAGLLPVGTAHAGPVSVTAAEEATLRAGEVVLRELPTRAEGAIRVLAVVDVKAPAEAVWAALLDFPSRKQSNPAVQSVENYKAPTATQQNIRWRVSKFGFDVVYHNTYVIDREEGRLEHFLDRTQQNDLVESRGVYDLAPSPAGAGWTRLAWEVESNFGQAIPGFVQKWMSTSATKDFMVDMARRAEARAAK